MKSLYELKRFKSSNQVGLLDALNLYIEYTEPALRTDSKEIMHCLDSWNDDYQDLFYVLGLYLNGQIIGFCELGYFEKEKFIIVDYLVIHENFRRNNSFYQFVEEIRNFINNEKLEYNYIVAEVACYHENLEPPESSRLLIRLLKIAHFGVVKCNYYVPRVGIYDFESEMKSIMMIYSPNDSNQIKKETFFQIVNAIYFKYYQRWHNLFVDEDEKSRYDKEIKDLIEKMEKQLITKKAIEINGLSGLFPVKTDPGTNKDRNVIKLLTAIFLFILCFLFVATLFSVIKTHLGWDSGTTGTILAASVGLTLFLVALIFERSSNIFSKIVEKLFDRF